MDIKEKIKNEIEWKKFTEGKRMIGISYWTALDVIPSMDEQEMIKNEIADILKRHNVKHYFIVDDELLSENIKDCLSKIDK